MGSVYSHYPYSKHYFSTGMSLMILCWVKGRPLFDR